MSSFSSVPSVIPLSNAFVWYLGHRVTILSGIFGKSLTHYWLYDNLVWESRKIWLAKTRTKFLGWMALFESKVGVQMSLCIERVLWSMAWVKAQTCRDIWATSRHDSSDMDLDCMAEFTLQATIWEIVSMNSHLMCQVRCPKLRNLFTQWSQNWPSRWWFWEKTNLEVSC